MKRVRTVVTVLGLVSLFVFAVWLAGPELAGRAVMQAHAAVDLSDPRLVEQGRYLARAGNCVACHTEPGGTPYAGGRKIETPFGDVFSTNLTPDADTGLGEWVADDFWRAMHYGKSRDGRLLYPAFPYPSYTRVTREDADAIFAYLKSLAPVSSARIEPTVRFPFNTQVALMVWRALYFEPGQHKPDPQRPEQWNRGAYLVEGLGHCDACHTPRTSLGGKDAAASYAGGPIPMLGWDAPPLNRPMSSAHRAELIELLGGGTSESRVTSGPMAEVVLHSLQYLTEQDLEAIVDYVLTLPQRQPQAAPPSGRLDASTKGQLRWAGARVYAEHCAECHGEDGRGEPYVYPALDGNPLVTSPRPNNMLQTVLFGGFAPSTEANPRPHGMPAYSHELSSEEIAAVLTYVREAWSNDAAAVPPEAVERRW